MLILTSPDIQPKVTIPMKHVFDRFTCTGQNISPALAWSGLPEGTKSYAVLCYDPDAPGGSGWWHWVVYNIPINVTSLPQGAGAVGGKQMPAGAVQGLTDFGEHGYGGPCPPPGDGIHHYHFSVLALDVDKLDVAPDATPGNVAFNLHFHTVERERIVGVFGR